MQVTEKALELLRQTEQELVGERARYAQLKADFDYNLGLLHDRDAELEAYDARFASLAEELQGCTRRCGTLQQDHDAALRRLAGADAVAAENRTLKDDLSRARRDAAELSAKLGDYHRLVTDLQQRAAQDADGRASVQIITERYEAQYSHLSESAEQLKAAVADLTRERAALQGESARLLGENSALRADNERMRGDAARAQSALDTQYSALLETERGAKLALEQKVSGLQAAAAQAHEDAERTAARLRADARKHRDEAERLRAQLAAQQADGDARAGALRRASDDAARELDTRARQLAKRVADLTAETEQRAAELAAAHSTLAAAEVAERLRVQERDAQHQRELDGLQAEVVRLRTDLGRRVVELQNFDVNASKVRTALVLEQKEAAALRERLARIERDGCPRCARVAAAARAVALPDRGGDGDRDGGGLARPSGAGGTGSAARRYKDIIQEMRREMERAVDDMRALELEKNTLAQRNASLDLALAAANDRLAAAEKRLDRCAAAQEGAEAAALRAGTLEAENGVLRAKVSRLEHGMVEPESLDLLRRLQAKLRQAATKIKELQSDKAGLEMDRQALRRRVETLTGVSARRGQGHERGRGKEQERDWRPENPGDTSIPSEISALDIGDIKGKIEDILTNAGIK